MAQNLTQATIHVGHDHSGSRQRVIPPKKDRDAWWKFLAGYPESAWSPRDRPVRKKLTMSNRTRVSADPAEVVQPGDAASLLDVHSRGEPSHLSIAHLYDLPRNVPRHPSSLDILRTTESTNAAPFAANPSISTEEVGEEHVEQLSPPEVTPGHLREIDHVRRLLLILVLLLILRHSEWQSTC